MSNMETHRLRATQAAKRDKNNSLSCDPARYGALPKSAWAKWYTTAYNS